MPCICKWRYRLLYLKRGINFLEAGIEGSGKIYYWFHPACGGFFWPCSLRLVLFCRSLAMEDAVEKRVFYNVNTL
jgi:hypothetical protein